jgi:hypothetical protein
VDAPELFPKCAHAGRLVGGAESAFVGSVSGYEGKTL